MTLSAFTVAGKVPGSFIAHLNQWHSERAVAIYYLRHAHSIDFHGTLPLSGESVELQLKTILLNLSINVVNE